MNVMDEKNYVYVDGSYRPEPSDPMYGSGGSSVIYGRYNSIDKKQPFKVLWSVGQYYDSRQWGLPASALRSEMLASLLAIAKSYDKGMNSIVIVQDSLNAIKALAQIDPSKKLDTEDPILSRWWMYRQYVNVEFQKVDAHIFIPDCGMNKKCHFENMLNIGNEHADKLAKESLVDQFNPKLLEYQDKSNPLFKPQNTKRLPNPGTFAHYLSIGNQSETISLRMPLGPNVKWDKTSFDDDDWKNHKDDPFEVTHVLHNQDFTNKQEHKFGQVIMNQYKTIQRLHGPRPDFPQFIVSLQPYETKEDAQLFQQIEQIENQLSRMVLSSSQWSVHERDIDHMEDLLELLSLPRNIANQQISAMSDEEITDYIYNVYKYVGIRLLGLLPEKKRRPFLEKLDAQDIQEFASGNGIPLVGIRFFALFPIKNLNDPLNRLYIINKYLSDEQIEILQTEKREYTRLISNSLLPVGQLLTVIGKKSREQKDKKEATRKGGMPNPSAVFCFNMGGQTELVGPKQPYGDSLCRLPNGIKVKPWEFYQKNKEQYPQHDILSDKYVAKVDKTGGCVHPSIAYCKTMGGEYKTYKPANPKKAYNDSLCHLPNGTSVEPMKFWMENHK